MNFDELEVEVTRLSLRKLIKTLRKVGLLRKEQKCGTYYVPMKKKKIH